MTKPPLGPVAAGDRLLVLERGNREVRETWAVVVKVGRVWIDLAHEDYPLRPKWRMRLDDQTDGSRIGYRDRFVTAEQHAYEQRMDAAREVLRVARVRPDFGSPWQDEDRLLALAEFVRAYNAEHPA